MKFALIYLLFNFSTGLMAETNWEELSEIGKNPKYVTAINSKNKSEIKLLDLGNGKFRIDSIRVYPLSQMVLTYDGKKELNDLCNDYFLYKTKTFKAKIHFKKAQGITLSDYVLSNGIALLEENIENPILTSDLKVQDLGANDKTLWIDKTPDSIKMGSDVNQYYVNLFNSHLKKSITEEVEIDLSQLNGLACDLGSGNINPVIALNVSYEKTLPTFNFWLKKEIFSEISNFYSSMMKSNLTQANDGKEFEKSQLILGWSIASAESSLRAEDNSVMPKILKNEKRKTELLKALDKSKEGESAELSWKRTFEVEIPKVKNMTRSLPLISGRVDILKVD